MSEACQREIVVVLGRSEEFTARIEDTLGRIYRCRPSRFEPSGDEGCAAWMVDSVRRSFESRGPYPIAILVDRELFPPEGSQRFQALSVLKSAVGRQVPYIVLLSASFEDDGLDAREAGARIVIRAVFTYERFARELDTAVREDQERQRSEENARKRGRARGFFQGVIATLVVPIAIGLVLRWFGIPSVNSDYAWDSIIVPGLGDGLRRDATLSLANTGESRKRGIRIVHLPRTDLLSFANICEKQMIDEIESGRTSAVAFTVVPRPGCDDAIRNAAKSGELWIGLTGPGHPETAPKRVSLDRLLLPETPQPPCPTQPADPPQ
jgi:hypothetical protein